MDGINTIGLSFNERCYVIHAGDFAGVMQSCFKESPFAKSLFLALDR